MRKVIIAVLGGLVILAGLLWFGGRWVLSFSTADYQGEIAVRGVKNPVEITFDARGIPQIWAKNESDLYFSLGWLHASERLFQMELTRRLVRGELSEIFGEAAYHVDKRQRLLGFRKKGRLDSESLSPESRQILGQYCAGINAWISAKKILPPEFVVLGFSPKRWQIKDCVSILIYQTWYAHALADRDEQYGELIGKLDGELSEILRRYQPWSPPTVSDNFLQKMFQTEHFPFRMTNASNSWVISPQKSASGAAIHASDPHLNVSSVPGFWYIAGLHSNDGTNVLGVTTPGIPSVVMGHNAQIAYAFTVAAVDVIDYYTLNRHPNDSLLVQMPDGYQAMQVEEIQIAVQGESRRRVEKLYYTDYGPVIHMDSTQVTCLHWAGTDFNGAEMLDAGLALQKADNFEDFRKYVTSFGALDVNWTYSDIHGNIGYQLGAPIPRRNYLNTFEIQAGADAARQWQGYHPLNETPYVFNPAEGWAVTCNNQIVSEKWPYDLPGFYDPYRITRATKLLREKEIFSVADAQKMQLDRVSGVAMRWKSLMADGANLLENSKLVAEINQWDGTMTVESQTAALFRLWWMFISKSLFEDELADDWKSGRFIKEEVLSANDWQVIDDRRTPDKIETARDISAFTLKYVLKNFSRQTYGDLSILHVQHPLSRVKILDAWLKLNRGPFPMGGDNGTLNANFNYWMPDQQKFSCAAAPSMRFVLDWADVDGFTINGNLGQSGNPFSPHYDDFLMMMQNGQRWNVPFSREKVYQKKQNLLRLIPGS